MIAQSADIPISAHFQPPRNFELGKSSSVPVLLANSPTSLLHTFPSSSAPSGSHAHVSEGVYACSPNGSPSGIRSLLLRSLGNGLQDNPLQAISKLIPAGYTQGEGRTTPEGLIDKIVDHHYSVSYSFPLFFFDPSSFLL